MDWNLKARAIERILIVCGGIISLVLGYLLFVKGVSGEASLIVEYDKTKIQIINALPGIFFAVFGAAILILAVRQNVTATVAHRNIPLVLSNATYDEANFNVTELNEANMEAQHVMEMLKSGDYKILHLACHGVAPETSEVASDSEEPNEQG